MKVYLFGNEDFIEDNLPFKVGQDLGRKIAGVEFVTIKPNEDLPFTEEKQVVIMDTVQGISKVKVIEGADLDKLVLGSKITVHDFDLGFQLKYLQKIGKLGQVIIIGLPQKGKVNYSLIHSILRKLVAQDIQGS